MTRFLSSAKRNAEIRLFLGDGFGFAVGVSRLLDRYVFFEWLKAFLLALGATFGILLLENLYNYLSDFIEFRASLRDIFRYYVYLVPTLLPSVIPVSLMISVLFALGNLHRHNEIVAMRASGISIWRLAIPLFVVGGVFSLLLFYLNAAVVPLAVERSRAIYENVRFASQAEQSSKDAVGLIMNVAFENKSEGRMWFMNRFSEYTYMGYGLTVYQMDEDGREQERLMAREGYYDDVAEHWVFLDGRLTTFDEDGTPSRSVAFDRRDYPDYQESPGLMKTLRKRPVDLSLAELQSILSVLNPRENPQVQAHLVRYHSILVSPFNCLLAVFIAVPFAVGGVRTNPMVGVSRACGLFFGYFLISSISTLLGEQAVVSAEAAAWTPVGIVFAFTLYCIRRVR